MINNEHSDVYDEAHIEADKKTQYRGGVARTKALVEKVVAIEDAKLEFINASEEGKELLDEGIALAVVDMLGKLEEIKITNPNYLDILNQAIVKAMEARTEREDEYKVEMDENKNLSLAVGERVFSVGEDGKVVIGERKYEYPAERTVSETEPVQG